MLRTLLAALVLLAASRGAIAASAGETAYKARCANCHSARSVRAKIARVPAAERPANLERFLPAHYAPDAAERAAIIEYLLAQPR